MRRISKFRPIVLSRHPSHAPLKQGGVDRVLKLTNKRVIVRLGSTTPTEKYNNRPGRPDVTQEINTVEAVQNSSSKYKMKKKFLENNVLTADWYRTANGVQFMKQTNEAIEPIDAFDLPYPIVAKSLHGSRNQGNTLIENEEQLNNWKIGKTFNNYIFEKYYSYAREYRIHVSDLGPFYSCRKVLKRDTPEDQKWFRNDLHCNWIKENGDNPELFDKPVNWDEITAECVKALKAVGLTIGACDVRVQSATKQNGQKRENPKFFIVEINSAPSFGEITKEMYIEEINKLI